MLPVKLKAIAVQHRLPAIASRDTAEPTVKAGFPA